MWPKDGASKLPPYCPDCGRWHRYGESCSTAVDRIPVRLVDLHTKPDSCEIYGTTSMREDIYVAKAATRELAEEIVRLVRL